MEKIAIPEKPILIFDFDGTIADSLQALIESLNKHAHYYGYKQITDVDSLKNKEMSEIFKELGLSALKVPFVVRAVRNEMHSKIQTLNPFPGIAETLAQLNQKSISLNIITSNSTKNVELFLQKNSMNFFQHIHGESSVFGKGKIIKKFLDVHNMQASKVIYIGDEIRDIEAAKYNNIQSAAVNWGFNSLQKLQEKNPNYLIYRPEDLLHLIS